MNKQIILNSIDFLDNIIRSHDHYGSPRECCEYVHKFSVEQGTPLEKMEIIRLSYIQDSALNAFRKSLLKAIQDEKVKVEEGYIHESLFKARGK